jgi:uncharacterized SAM-binding protein YcdF (DUF218 family)
MASSRASRRQAEGRAEGRAGPGHGPLALVVLGCTLRDRGTGRRLHGEGDPSGGEAAVPFGGALGRRVRAAAREWARSQEQDPEEDRVAVVIASGGRVWNGRMEADAMAAALVALGVPAEVVVRERTSHHTGDNASFTAALCGRRDIARVAIVTCDWHFPRAKLLFEAEGLQVERGVPVGNGDAGLLGRWWLWGREGLLRSLSRRRARRGVLYTR